MDNYHLTKNEDGNWSLKREGAQRATEVFRDATKDEAVRRSAERLRESDSDASLKIHRQDGVIQEERTYPRAADPSQSPG